MSSTTTVVAFPEPASCATVTMPSANNPNTFIEPVSWLVAWLSSSESAETFLLDGQHRKAKNINHHKVQDSTGHSHDALGGGGRGGVEGGVVDKWEQ